MCTYMYVHACTLSLPERPDPVCCDPVGQGSPYPNLTQSLLYLKPYPYPYPSPNPKPAAHLHPTPSALIE